MKIDRTMSSVYDALPPSSAREFRAELRRVLVSAVEDLNVDVLQMRLDGLVLTWWAVASAHHSPSAAAATESARRLLQGDASDVIPASEAFGRGD
ncbi:DUF6247 family protein [Streptomyces sp. NPDC008079]|uniref:DUF6247 family protein n=1 Tax=Streptomyces sp. NPDC008079 TaxID=3364806 RepID=UPI0036EC6360